MISLFTLCFCRHSNLSFSCLLVFTMTSSSMKLWNSQQQHIWPTLKCSPEVPLLTCSCHYRRKVWHFHQHFTHLRLQGKTFGPSNVASINTNQTRITTKPYQSRKKYKMHTETILWHLYQYFSYWRWQRLVTDHPVPTVIIIFISISHFFNINFNKMDVNGRL